jgi:hypothetical protein
VRKAKSILFYSLSLLLLDYTLYMSWLGETFLHHRSKNIAAQRQTKKQKERSSYATVVKFFHAAQFSIICTDRAEAAAAAAHHSHVNAALPAIWLKQFESHELASAGQLFHHHPSCTKSRSCCNFLMRERRLGRNFSERCAHSSYLNGTRVLVPEDATTFT